MWGPSIGSRSPGCEKTFRPGLAEPAALRRGSGPGFRAQPPEDPPRAVGSAVSGLRRDPAEEVRAPIWRMPQVREN